jgi:PAS domain S-box-containing protein
MVHKAALRISLSYLGLGFLWVLFSDRLAALLAPDASWLALAQTLKGWLFVLGTALPLYAFSRRVIGDLVDTRAARDRSTDAAAQSERRFRRLFEQLPLPVQGFGPDLKVRYWNPASERLYGYSRSTAMGASITDLIIRQDDRESFSSTVQKLRRYRLEACSGEFKALTQSGNQVPVYSKMVLVQEDDQEDFFCLDWDLSEIRRARERIRESEERYRTIFQQSRDAIVIADARGICVDCNDTALDLFQCARAEILGQTGMAFSPPVQVDGTESAVRFTEVFADSNREAQVFEWRYRRADGSVIDTQTTVAWVSVAGQPHIITGIRDITAERDAAQALKRSEERFRGIFENAAAGIAVVDSRGRYVQFNDKWLEMLGYSAAEMSALTNADVTHPEDLPRTREHLARLIRGECRSYQMEKRFLRKSGEVFWAFLSVAAIPDDVFEGPLALGVMVDINEAKTMQERQRMLEKRLILGQKAEALGTLAGGIAHDFNNVLFGILGYAEMAQTALDDGHPARGYLQSVRNASLRARELVQQILAFSRQAELSAHPLQPRQVIQEALTLLRASLPSTIAIHTWYDSDAFVNADPVQLHQVIMNLCTNAGHAMEQAGGRLFIELRNLEIDRLKAERYAGIPPGDYVQLTVSDTGKGIPASILEKIFDPYFTTKPKGKGTGMGLAVVQGIVRQMGGAVTVNSQVGVGTTFNLLLPAIAHQERPLPQAVETPTRGSGRVLFVDDEEILVQLGQHLLGHLGYEVEAFQDSQSALAALRELPEGFDLFITDYTMPHMTGLQLAEKVKALRPDIPILLTTGYSEHLTEERARGAGVRSILRKPVTLMELSNHVNQALQAKAGEGASGASSGS